MRRAPGKANGWSMTRSSSQNLVLHLLSGFGGVDNIYIYIYIIYTYVYTYVSCVA